jgi:hypothetical protein
MFPVEAPQDIRDEAPQDIRVARWPTERRLLILNALASAGLWFLFVRSFQSSISIVMSGAIFALMNVSRRH